MNTLEAEIKLFLKDYSEGVSSIRGKTFHTRSKKRGGLFRLSIKVGGSVVVKVRRARNLKERIKSFVCISNGWREWSLHKFIFEAGIQVPKPLAFFRFNLQNGERYEVMAIEDLGETECGVSYLKRLIENGQENKIMAFEERVIDITEEMVSMRIIDVDNQLNNYIIDQDGRIIRVDFECACRRRFLPSNRVEYATMLDRLFRSHLHATHPESDRTNRFISRVGRKLSISNDIRCLAIDITRKELQREKEVSGIDYSVGLKWT